MKLAVGALPGGSGVLALNALSKGDYAEAAWEVFFLIPWLRFAGARLNHLTIVARNGDEVIVSRRAVEAWQQGVYNPARRGQSLTSVEDLGRALKAGGRNADEVVDALGRNGIKSWWLGGTAWIDDLAVNQGRGWRAGRTFDYEAAKKWTKEAYAEYLLEKGKPIDFISDALNRGNPAGKPRRLGTLIEYPDRFPGTLGNYRGQIQLFEYANLPTLMEELYHFRQAKMMGVWGKRAFTRSEIQIIERQVRMFLRDMGFVELPYGALPPPGF